MKNSTRIATLILLLAVICLTITGCQKGAEQATADSAAQTGSDRATRDEAIITIPLTDETAKAKEKMQTLNVKESLSEKGFPAALDMLKNREGQDFPQTKTKLTQNHSAVNGNDLYTLENDDAESILFYLHGGAYAYGISEKQVLFCDDMAQRLNAKVYIPLYPLTPQATCRDAYPFLDAAYAEALKEGKPIYLIGDSAGGGLALGFAEYLRDNGTQLPQKLFLLSPWVDVTMSDPAIAEYEQKDLMLNSYGLIELGKLWAGELDTKDPLVSPLYGEMKGLPPTMIFTGTDEVMVPDNTTLYHKMREAGVDCSLIFGEGLWHVFVQDEFPEAVSARQMIVDACR